MSEKVKVKVRLDTLLVDRGYFDSREKAQRALMAGQIRSEGKCLDKPGMKVACDIALEVLGEVHPYVSRGGLKLEKALREFGIDPTGRIALDIGASTGGFTDCLLQFGVARVYAVDVGYGQLAWKLRGDSHVIVFERMNARYLDPALFDPLPDLVVADVSFISLAKIFPSINACLNGTGPVITLIKPQFEAGPELVGKNGVVRDAAVQCDVILSVIRSAADFGFALDKITGSPIKGPQGNIEFLAMWHRGSYREPDAEYIAYVVEKTRRETEVGKS